MILGVYAERNHKKKEDSLKKDTHFGIVNKRKNGKFSIEVQKFEGFQAL